MKVVFGINNTRMNAVLIFLWMQITAAAAVPANKSFDIVYLNLERHQAKRAHVERMLKHANCTFTRFNAVDGRALFDQTKSILDYTGGIAIAPTDESIQQRIDSDNAGRAGCHLSHLIVLRTIESLRAARPVLVLEDDIDLDEHFAEKVESVLADPPAKWDIILLGAMFRANWWGHPRNKLLVAGKYDACTHAYLVNGAESASKLAAVINTARCPGRPVDLLLERAFRNDPSFAYFCFRPMIAVQRRDLFESDISLPTSTPLYKRVFDRLFPNAFLAPLKHSLSKASSGIESGAKPASATLALCFSLLLLAGMLG